MADLKISQLNTITTLTPATDVLPVVDVNGVTKKITTNQILGSSGTATLASATITGDLTVDTSTLKVDSANDQVGIRTASPIVGSSLDVRGAVGTGIEIQSLSVIDTSPLAINNGGGLSFGYVFQSPSAVIGRAGSIKTIKENATDGNYASAMVFGVTANGVATAERMRINSTGDVSIANGNLVMSTSGKGIDFSATANSSGTMTSELLSDYEEGTWTIGLTFGGGSTGLTTALNTGRYTKVGRQVTVCGRLELSNKGSSTGAAVITGLPFSIANTNDAQQAASFRCNGVSYTGAFQGYGTAGSTTIPLEQISEAGSNTNLTDSNFVNGTSIQISLTYTV